MREYIIRVRNVEAWHRDRALRESIIRQAREYAGNHPGVYVRIKKLVGRASWETVGTYRNVSGQKREW